jgi:hypothetical protein
MACRRRGDKCPRILKKTVKSVPPSIVKLPVGMIEPYKGQSLWNNANQIQFKETSFLRKKGCVTIAGMCIFQNPTKSKMQRCFVHEKADKTTETESLR